MQVPHAKGCPPPAADAPESHRPCLASPPGSNSRLCLLSGCWNGMSEEPACLATGGVRFTNVLPYTGITLSNQFHHLAPFCRRLLAAPLQGPELPLMYKTWLISFSNSFFVLHKLTLVCSSLLQTIFRRPGPCSYYFLC